MQAKTESCVSEIPNITVLGHLPGLEGDFFSFKNNTRENKSNSALLLYNAFNKNKEVQFPALNTDQSLSIYHS